MSEPKIVGLGDAVIDRYIDRGLGYPGGSACNVAVHARRLGAWSGFVGGIGDDSAGRWIVQALRAENVDVTHVQTYSSQQAYADVIVGADGGRQFGAWRPTPVPLALDESLIAYLASSDVVHTSYSSHVESLVPEISELARLSFDFSYKDFAYAEPLLGYLHGAFFSRSELSSGESKTFALKVSEFGPRLVAVTRGEAGSVLVLDGQVVEQPASVAEKVIDTLGAGDAFAAAILLGLEKGDSITDAAAAAAEYAASICAIDGGFGRAMSLQEELR